MDERENAFLTLLAAWRVVREPRLGELIEEASALLAAERPELPKKAVARHGAWLERVAECDPRDLHHLLPVMVEKSNSPRSRQRLDALAGWPPDPRIGRALLFLLISPPFSSKATQPFWSEVCDQTVLHADRETQRHLQAIVGTYSTDAMISDHTAPLMQRKVGRVIQKLAKNPPGERDLSQEEWSHCQNLLGFIRGDATSDGADITQQAQEAVAALSAAFGSPRGPFDELRRNRNRGVDEERFLREIAEAPEDDDLRLVFADWLLEHGDPRGEMIQLQFERLAGTLTPRQETRERRLIEKHRGRWVKNIAKAIVLKEAVFARGFLDTCRIGECSERRMQKMVGDITWATVREMNVRAYRADEILLHPVMKSLRVVQGVLPELATELITSETSRPIEELQIRYSFTRRFYPLLGEARGLPNLRRIVTWLDRGDVKPFCKTWLGHHLEVFAVWVPTHETAGNWWKEFNVWATGPSFELLCRNDHGQWATLAFTRDEIGHYSRIVVDGGEISDEMLAGFLDSLPRRALGRVSINRDFNDGPLAQLARRKKLEFLEA